MRGVTGVLQGRLADRRRDFDGGRRGEGQGQGCGVACLERFGAGQQHDVIAARLAGITPIFYNGAGWSQSWLDKIFPGTLRHPHRPDAVVNTIAEVTELARLMLAQDLRVQRAREKLPPP